ncbi:MAG: rod shape-determining protein MreC [bacterium]|nr:rod shape-determining protein MreC [bacterium]
MKNKSKGFNIFLIVIGVFVFFSVLYFSLHKNVNISLSYLKDLLYKPFMDANNNVDLIGKNLNVELKSEINDLKKLTGIDNVLTDFNYVNATVIERNNSYWLNKLTINKGKSSGIDIGQAVVVSEGLVGKITSISDNTATVKLITSSDNDNKISVKIKYKETYIYKVLEYDSGLLVVKGINNDIELDKNTEVITSGLSDIYPSGIVIGYVMDLKSDKYGVSKTAYIESKVDFDNLRFVSVIERPS